MDNLESGVTAVPDSPLPVDEAVAAADPVSQSARRAAPRGRLVIYAQLLFVTALVAAVFGGLWRATMDQDASPVPHEVAGLTLVRSQAGDEAVAQISRLHGKDVGVTKGYVASYGGTEAFMDVWVAETDTTGQAETLLSAMTDRIAKSTNSPFTDLQKLDIGGKTVYGVRSGPERHYFWMTGKKVIWIGIQSPNAPLIAAKAVQQF